MPKLPTLKESKPCKLCTHPDRIRIDAGLFEGNVSIRAASEQTGICRETVRRHIREHLSVSIKAAGGGEHPSLLAELADIEFKTKKLLAEAIREKNPDLAVKLLQRREQQLRLAGELTGQLQEKAPNASADERKAKQLERVVENALAEAKKQNIDISLDDFIKELAKNEPDVLRLLPLTRFATKPSEAVVH